MHVLYLQFFAACISECYCEFCFLVLNRPTHTTGHLFHSECRLSWDPIRWSGVFNACLYYLIRIFSNWSPQIFRNEAFDNLTHKLFKTTLQQFCCIVREGSDIYWHKCDSGVYNWLNIQFTYRILLMYEITCTTQFIDHASKQNAKHLKLSFKVFFNKAGGGHTYLSKI